MSVQQYSVRWKEDSIVVMFVCQLMDIAIVRAITVLGQLNKWKVCTTVQCEME